MSDDPGFDARLRQIRDGYWERRCTMSERVLRLVWVAFIAMSVFAFIEAGIIVAAVLGRGLWT